MIFQKLAQGPITVINPGELSISPKFVSTDGGQMCEVASVGGARCSAYSS